MRMTERELEDAMYPPLEEPPLEDTHTMAVWIVICTLLIILSMMVLVLAN